MARVTIYGAQLRREGMENSLSGRKRIADEIVSRFQSTARVRTGRFRAGARAVTEGDRVFVENTDPNAFYKEYGTSRTRAQADMTNAARQYGKYSGFQPRGRRG